MFLIALNIIKKKKKKENKAFTLGSRCTFL